MFLPVYNAERCTASSLLALLALNFCVRDQSAYIAQAHRVGKSTLTRLRRIVTKNPGINELHTTQTMTIFFSQYHYDVHINW